MTKDDIIRMARGQGLPETEVEGVFRVNVDDLGRMLAAEREACAQIADEYEDQLVTGSCARDIRARISTMDDAVAAGDSVLLNEQAALLRECRFALDELLRDKPMLAAKICGSTTLSNLRASLYDYRPQGVFAAAPEDKK